MAKKKKKSSGAKVMCKWGSKKWKVSWKKVKAITELGYSMSYDSDEKKKDKRTITITYDVYQEMGVDVRKELKGWYKFLGKKNGLYIGKKRIGPKKVRLDAVDISGVQVTQRGETIKASFSLTFTEP